MDPLRQKARPSLSLLPPVDEILAREPAARLITQLGRDRVVAMVRSIIDEKRSEMAAGEGQTDAVTREGLTDEISTRLALAGSDAARAGVRRVINATGVVIHTNLGRAPFSEQAVRAICEAGGYSTIEYDLAAGGRGERGAKAVSLIKHLTGAEDALVVNNCAAAALFVLSVFAQGREVIVSRGELVEIGGDFRIPDVLSRSGAVLREVGTTNRTHFRDYQNAITDRTALILKVHTSNYRITGFTSSVSTGELAALARQHGRLLYEDAGSGGLIGLTRLGIKGEPVIRKVIESGADIVTFSGDKLLGGPQAGLVAGRASLIGRMRTDPFYRALRVDKTITAALEATLESFARGAEFSEIPVLGMLSARPEALAARCGRFAERLAAETLPGLHVELKQGVSAVGGGASPDAAIATTMIALSCSEMSEADLERRLRDAPVPVITRIEGGKVLIDLRTVAEKEEADVIAAIAAAAGKA